MYEWMVFVYYKWTTFNRESTTKKKEEEEEKTLNKYGLEIIYGIHVLIDSCSRCRYEQKIYFENDWAK